jgi:DNA-binding CsgD family transcriptional regulator
MTARAAQVLFLQSALHSGDAGVAESAASLLLADGMSLAELYDDVLLPFFADLRRGFESGTLRLADEHLASRAALELVTLLGRRQVPWAERSFGRGERGLIVLGAVPDEQHLLGMRMLAQVLQVRGWSVAVLDALPYEALGAYCAAMRERPAAIGLTLQVAPPLGALRAGIVALREELPEVPVVLGGQAIIDNPGLPVKVSAAGGATSLVAAVDLIEDVTNPLTRRERQILELVAAGASNAEIATTLSVHSSTVKTHLEHVAGKLGTSDRTAAAVQGLRRGWIA